MTLAARDRGAGTEPLGTKDRGSRRRGEGDLVAERDQLADEVAGPPLHVDAALVEVRAEVDEAGVSLGPACCIDHVDTTVPSCLFDPHRGPGRVSPIWLRRTPMAIGLTPKT